MRNLKYASAAISYIFSRIRRRISYANLLVLAFDSSLKSVDYSQLHSNNSHKSWIGFTNNYNVEGIDFEEVLLGNNKAIDELTAIDPWHISRSVSIEMLYKKWHCYVANVDNHVVACNWSIVGQGFRDDYLGRSFQLGVNETYFWRGYCSPNDRGRGIQGLLVQHAVRCRHIEDGCSFHITLARANNRSVLRCLAKCGWMAIGRAGFIEILGVRLHYLFGRDAFKETKQRTFFQIRRRISS